MKKLTTVLLFVLVSFMLTLWISYIALRFDSEILNETVLERDFWIFSEQNEYRTQTVADDYFFSPLSVSLILSSKGYTSAYNSHLTHILWKDSVVLFNEILSDSYICSKTDTYEWEKALKKEDAIFIEYPASLPYTAIALFSEKTDSFTKSEVCNIKSVIFFNDNSGTLSALSKDSEGNIYSYSYSGSDSPSIVYDFNSNNLAAYTVNKGFIPFEFNINAKDNTRNESLPPEYKLLSSSPALSSITVSSPLKETVSKALDRNTTNALEIATEPEVLQFFDAFEINPNIVGFYSNHISGLFFVDEDTILEISPSGRVYYSVTDTDYTPITVSSLLNSENTSFSSNQLLTAATVFLSRFDNSFIGREAVPVFDSMTYSKDKDTFTFNFSYYYELAEVLNNGKKIGITLTFNSLGLISADIETLSVLKSDSVASSENYLDMSLTPNIVLKMLTSDSSFAPVYNYTSNSIVLPYWMEKRKEKS